MTRSNPPRKLDNLLALAVLAYLSREPMHPYQLSRTLRDHNDVRSIKFTHGSLYMVVQQLAKAGLVVPLETTRQGQRPERTIYAISDAGRNELREWLRELVEVPRHEYPHFVAALSFIAALPPDQVVELLQKRLARLADVRSETLEAIDHPLSAGVHPLFLVEEEYRLALLDAEIRFVEQFIDHITHGEHGWGRMWAELFATPAKRTSQESDHPAT